MHWLALLTTLSLSTTNPALPREKFGFLLASNGTYSVFTDDWQFSGSFKWKMGQIDHNDGSDSIGTFHETTCLVNEGAEKLDVKAYPSQSIVVFDVSYPKGATGNGVAFPDFDGLPQGLNKLSFRDVNFSRPEFKTNETCTPWLCFDSTGMAYIFSPASNFMVSKLKGDAETEAASALNDDLKSVPADFHQKSVLVLTQGINAAWDKWGSTMQKLFNKQSPANDADTVLKKFGYWTDNGADYYYNYDPKLGYAGTLLALRKSYQSEGIPLGYLQLDSWWYDKSINGADGKPGDESKNANLPKGDWNRYGGTISYRADKDLFPQGLGAFHDQLGLPLAVHNRWIDRNSVYAGKFKFSDVAAIDPAWWNDTDTYLQTSGVVLYEQDWLDHIYANSPDLSTTVGPGDAFANGMADAAKSHGLDLQYCMATPRFFMQGLEYSNLTNIRTSDDRFDIGKWHDFLYVSQFARAVGIWPWSDVFKSGETGNMIVSVLSAGPVGTGDAMGKENKDNIMKAVLPDGTIVKPDASLLPIDQTYLDEAAKVRNPFVASTYTGSGPAKTTYIFAFARNSEKPIASISPSALGLAGKYYVYDFSRDAFTASDDSSVITGTTSSGYLYLEVAPVLKGDICILGDLAKFVTTGRQRLTVTPGDQGPTVTVHFAAGEQSVTITGVAGHQPKVAGSGTLGKYDASTGRFEVTVKSSGGADQTFTVS